MDKNRAKYIIFPLMLVVLSQPNFVKTSEIPIVNPWHSYTITFYTCNEQIADEADSNGHISSYLGRDVRNVINLYPKRGEHTTVNAQYMVTNGKDVLGQTNDNGTTLNSVRQYTPYGKETYYMPSTSKGALVTNYDLTILSNPYSYSEYYSDAESRLCYLNARYYSPELMRFISRDSYDLIDRYAYADGNPIANIDPTGHIPQLTINLFARFLTNFITPIEMNGTAVATDPLSISSDVFNFLIIPEYEIKEVAKSSMMLCENLIEEEYTNISQEVFLKNCKEIFNDITTKIKYTQSVIDPSYDGCVSTQRLNSYSDNIYEIIKRDNMLHGAIKSGESDMSKICFLTEFGDCDHQAMVVLEQGKKKFGYIGAIHSRVVSNLAPHYFAHLSDKKGNQAILDTWAGFLFHNGQNEFGFYYPFKNHLIYDKHLVTDNLLLWYNKEIVDKFDFGNMRKNSFEDF